MNTTLVLSIGAALALANAGNALAVDTTAFGLIKEGDHYIGEQSRDHVVEIHSDRSAGSLTPNVWYIDYYDPDAKLKAVEVKFGGGQKMNVDRPFRLLEPITGADRVLDSSRLKVDSDRALNVAKSQPVLNGLNLTSSQMWLQHGDLGPQWKVRLWAAKANNPSHQADLGVVIISANDASIIKSDLHPDHVN